MFSISDFHRTLISKLLQIFCSQFQTSIERIPMSLLDPLIRPSKFGNVAEWRSPEGPCWDIAQYPTKLFSSAVKKQQQLNWKEKKRKKKNRCRKYLLKQNITTPNCTTPKHIPCRLSDNKLSKDIKRRREPDASVA